MKRPGPPAGLPRTRGLRFPRSGMSTRGEVKLSSAQKAGRGGGVGGARQNAGCRFDVRDSLRGRRSHGRRAAARVRRVGRRGHVDDHPRRHDLPGVRPRPAREAARRLPDGSLAASALLIRVAGRSRARDPGLPEVYAVAFVNAFEAPDPRRAITIRGVTTCTSVTTLPAVPGRENVRAPGDRVAE
jgi:hypothetical protein